MHIPDVKYSVIFLCWVCSAPGLVVLVAPDADVQQLFLALGAAPGVRLLTTGPRALHLFASLDVTAYPQASRFHYPFGQGEAESHGETVQHGARE